ncbi:Exodeoxyribonuclease VII large subunit [Alteromonadaceae bacterium Bs31]|nr:Exodeoxyribonuclease VII large subunit [Alteromonadaceae bacterium Bs31]
MSNFDLFSPEQKPATPKRSVLSVSELNRQAKQLLEIHLPLLWVEGELSNFSKPSSGHWYFSLKDEKAQVRCAMFRARNAMFRGKLKDGDRVKVRARVTLYEGRGDFQLVVEHIEEAGSGSLQKQFEQLKAKLQAEGLFESTIKQALPSLPKSIGVVTSPTGAAIKDVLSVLSRRFPCLPVTIIPSSVQGDKAGAELCKALILADKQGFDAIILCRGGGSIEDLWAFNEERLARTIYSCKTPIVSGVGHESDFTIADFVADIRAATPSAAAELLSPDKQALCSRFEQIESKLQKSIQQTLLSRQTQLTHHRRLLRHPGEQINSWSQRLDQLENHLLHTFKRYLLQRQVKVNKERASLFHYSPQNAIERTAQQVQSLSKELRFALQQHLKLRKAGLAKAVDTLQAVSPLNTLARGYAIVSDSSGKVVAETSKIAVGDAINIKLAKSTIDAKVTALKSN